LQPQLAGAELTTLAPAAPVWTNGVQRSNRLQTKASAVFMVLNMRIEVKRGSTNVGFHLAVFA
jgi:hypothetical protein